MKFLRVPWIQCRADEAGARTFEFEWKRLSCSILAYSEVEARTWWHGLSPEERDALLGLEEAPASNQLSFF